MQKLQDSVFALVKTTNLSPAVFSFLQPTDDSGGKWNCCCCRDDNIRLLLGDDHMRFFQTKRLSEAFSKTQNTDGWLWAPSSV